MRKTVLACDVCRVDGAKAIAVEVRADGSESETVQKEMDLCGDCILAQLQTFIEALPIAGRAQLVRSVVISGKLLDRERIFRGL